MTDIALSRTLEHLELAEMFRRTLPMLPIFLIPLADLGAMLESSRPEGSGLLTFGAAEGVYPCGIGVVDLPDSVEDGVLVALARHLSEHLNCDVVCDGTAYGDGSHPYFSVFWRSGEAWLADDSGADPYDGTGEAVRPLRRLTEPMPWLDSTGRVTLR